MRVNPYTRLLPLSSPVREPKKHRLVTLPWRLLHFSDAGAPSRRFSSTLLPERHRHLISSVLLPFPSISSSLLDVPAFSRRSFLLRRPFLLHKAIPPSVDCLREHTSSDILLFGRFLLQKGETLDLFCYLFHVFFFWNGNFQVCILNFIYDNKIEVNIAQLSLLSNFNVIGALECYGFQHVV